MVAESVFLTIGLGCSAIAFAAGGFGSVVSLRARNLEADVLAHGILPGLVLGVILSYWVGVDGTLIAQVIAAVGGVCTAAVISALLSVVSSVAKKRLYLESDSIQAVMLGLGFGLGLLLLSWVQTHVPAQRAGLDRLLLGNAALLTTTDIWVGAGLALSLSVMGFVFRRPLVSFLFDPVSWRANGGRMWVANALYTMCLFLVTLIAMRLVGAVLMVALFSVPYLIARPWAHMRLTHLVLLSASVAAAGALLGVWVSTLALGPEARGLPAGPSIVLSLFVMMLISQLMARLWQRLADG